MKIEYQKYKIRKKRAVDFWLKVAADYNSGISATDISKKYINPVTNKHYTREHIYWILKKINKI